MATRNANDWLLEKHPHLFSQCYVSTGTEDDTLAVADQWYDIAGPWTNKIVENFSVSAGGVLTFSGEDATFLYAPSAIVIVSKVGVLTFGTFVNDILTTTTEVDFVAAGLAATVPISRTILLALATGDTVQLKAKFSVLNTTLTSQNNITIKG